MCCFLFQLTAEPNRPNSWFRQCCHSTPYIFQELRTQPNQVWIFSTGPESYLKYREQIPLLRGLMMEKWTITIFPFTQFIYHQHWIAKKNCTYMLRWKISNLKEALNEIVLNRLYSSSLYYSIYLCNTCKTKAVSILVKLLLFDYQKKSFTTLINKETCIFIIY